jgi:hypothetical protein
LSSIFQKKLSNLLKNLLSGLDYNIIVIHCGKKNSFLKMPGKILICLLVMGLTGCGTSIFSSTPTLPSFPTLFDLPTSQPTTQSAFVSPTETMTPMATEFQAQVPVDTLPPVEEVITATLEVGIPTSDLPTEEGTPLPTPTARRNFPDPMILIEGPGPLSKLVTPIVLQGSFSPGEDGMLYIELIGSENALVARQVLNYQNMSYAKAYVTDSIPFDILAAGEFARLVVSTKDREQRLSAVASVDLILLQMGSNLLAPPAVVEEPYVIQSPKPNEVVKGGVARVYGVFKPVNNSPLLIQLTGPTGEVLGYGSFLFAPITFDQAYSVFVVDIPYKVYSDTQTRLSIYQSSDNRIPGIVWLTSQKITLSP